MKLYSLQSVETVALLHKDIIVYLHFGKRPPASTDNWVAVGEARNLKYNEVKKHDYSSLPVQWFDNRSIAVAHFNADTTGSVLVQANIPDAIVLLPELVTPYIDLNWIMELPPISMSGYVEM
jgi:hypothetical protein